MQIKMGDANIGVLSVLGIIFIVLKLTHFISWSWIWVLSPFWMPMVLFLLILGSIFLFSFYTDWSKK